MENFIRSIALDASDEVFHLSVENFIRSIALDAARHFECTDTAATLLIEALCAEGNLELWDWIQVGSHDEHAGN